MKPGPVKIGERVRGTHLLGGGWEASRPEAFASELPKVQACAAGTVAPLPMVGPAPPNVEMLPRLSAWAHTSHLLSPGEGMVETGNVGHDGLLIGLWGIHNIWGVAARYLLAKARVGE